MRHATCAKLGPFSNENAFLSAFFGCSKSRERPLKNPGSRAILVAVAESRAGSLRRILLSHCGVKCIQNTSDFMPLIDIKGFCIFLLTVFFRIHLTTHFILYFYKMTLEIWRPVTMCAPFPEQPFSS